MNRVYLFGNLGDDPELKATKGGKPVLNFRMVTSEKYKNNDGEWQEKTSWHSVVVWGGQADWLSRQLKKGSRVMVEGSIEYQQYEDKEGNKRYQTKINAQRVEPGVLTKKSEEESFGD